MYLSSVVMWALDALTPAVCVGDVSSSVVTQIVFKHQLLVSSVFGPGLFSAESCQNV